MTIWNLGSGNPLSLILAADANLAQTDYPNDQIWELSLGGGEPATLSLQTTYGLRARAMRLFPRFTLFNSSVTDPALFFRPPSVACFTPSFIRLTFEPFENLFVEAEYWVTSSQSVAGRLLVSNATAAPLSLQIDWIAQLTPLGLGEGIGIISQDLLSTLQGRTSNLAPVCLVGGEVQMGSAAYPSLGCSFELPPQTHAALHWAQAALNRPNLSVELARPLLSRRWDAEIARIELSHAAQVLEIETGDPDWNAAFALSQTAALRSFLSSTEYLPNPSFVLSRQPDQGNSSLGSGADYNPLWSGQSVFDAFYLARCLLPGSADVLAGVVENFLAVQEESGSIDARPGLAGQRSRCLAQPLLASLVLLIAPYRPPEWSQKMAPALLKFFEHWFSESADLDADGFPEYTFPLQSGIEDSPIFHPRSDSPSSLSGRAPVFDRLESPALGAMLYREALALIQLLGPDESPEILETLKKRAAGLKQRVDSTWDAQTQIYRYREYATHQSLPEEDCSLLLPLWAELCSPEQASALIEKTLFSRFMEPFGVPLCPVQQQEGNNLAGCHVLMPWNQLLGEGLLNYGYREAAAAWFTHLMNAITQNLKESRNFYQYIQSQNGRPFGERGHIHGLVPLGFFFDILGLKLITDQTVILQSVNPFPWPITVQYHRVTVMFRQQESIVSFPNGQTVTVTGPGIHRVTRSSP